MPAPTISPNTIHSASLESGFSAACKPAPRAVRPVPTHIAGWKTPNRETVQPARMPKNMFMKISGSS